MLGGMWGFKRSIDKNLSSNLYELITNVNISRVYNNVTEKHGKDQDFLSDYIYTFASKSAIEHDSFTCHLYKNSQPWPTKRTGNCFVGCVTDCVCNSKTHDNKTFTDTCPRKCRPKNHKNWIYC